MLVCSAGMDAVPTAEQLEGGGTVPWEALGFSAANPAGDLGETGVLCPLLLLLLLDRSPQSAAALLAAARGQPVQLPGQQLGGEERAPQPLQRPPGFALAEVAVHSAAWVQRRLAGGGLAGEARRLGSYFRAAGGFLHMLYSVIACLL